MKAEPSISWIAAAMLVLSLGVPAALAADVASGLPPYESLPTAPAVVDGAPIVPVPVAAPVPVVAPVLVPVPAPAAASVVIPDPFQFFGPPERLPPPNIFSTRIYYMQPPPKYAAEPRGGADADIAEAEHYGYGRHLPPPRPLGFYGSGGVD